MDKFTKRSDLAIVQFQGAVGRERQSIARDIGSDVIARANNSGPGLSGSRRFYFVKLHATLTAIGLSSRAEWPGGETEHDQLSQSL